MSLRASATEVWLEVAGDTLVEVAQFADEGAFPGNRRLLARCCAVRISFVQGDRGEDAPRKTGGVGYDDPFASAVDFQGFFEVPQVGQVHPGGRTTRAVGILHDGCDVPSTVPDFGADDGIGQAQPNAEAVEVVNPAAGECEEGACDMIGYVAHGLKQSDVAAARPRSRVTEGMSSNRLS